MIELKRSVVYNDKAIDQCQPRPIMACVHSIRESSRVWENTTPPERPQLKRRFFLLTDLVFG